MATSSSKFSQPNTPRRHLASLSRMDSWDADEDSQSLFQKHNIIEIRELEKRARGDIERKKEELRLMVGEQYRDLIDAADTIGDMKQCSDQINSSVKMIQENCKQLYQTHLSRGAAGQISTPAVNDSKTKFYSVASQMKLLVDTPEKIWSALEHHQYLKAAELYLLAQNIVTSLHIDNTTNMPSKLLASFPILPHQWSSISHFKHSILQGSRRLLNDHTQTEQTMVECLCAIMFLEDTSPRQVFNEFLLARQASLQELFHPSQQATGIKAQLCEVVRLIMSTLYQIFVLFTDQTKTTPSENHEIKPLLFEMLEKISSKSDTATTEGELLKQLFGQEFDLTVLRHLPPSVAGFRPRVRSISSFITSDYIQDNCTTWFEKCVDDVKKGMDSFLKYVGTMKGLASIREALWELLNPHTEHTSGTYQATVVNKWEEVTSCCLGNTMSLWNELFRDEFISRCKTILRGQLDSLATSCKTSTMKALDDLATDSVKPDRSVSWERNLSLYIWQESSTDLPTSAGWAGKHRDDDASNGIDGGLSLKTKACTPVVQGLCETFNNNLGLILEDASFFIKFSDNNVDEDKTATNFMTPNKLIITAENENSPFERFGDSKELENFLQTACSDVLMNFLGHLDSQLVLYKEKLSSFSWCQPLFRDEMADIMLNIDRGLLLARLCRALSEYSFNLSKLMGEDVQNGKTRKQRFVRTPSRKKLTDKKDSKLQEIKQNFKSTSLDAFSIWSEWVSSMFKSSFQTFLLNSHGTKALLSATCWDEIVIDEETEAGKKVNSTIQVPSQVSAYVTNLLFSLCEEINRIGGHAIDRSVLRQLVGRLSDDTLVCYETLVENHSQEIICIDQKRSLQALFDFKFVSTIFGDRSKTENIDDYKSRYEKVIGCLEDIVDPFDLNVFSPYINSNLNKHLQRCGVLYGVLLNIDKHSQLYGLPQRPSRGSQDQHNIMPLATNIPRFTLLPLSSHHTEHENINKLHRRMSDNSNEKTTQHDSPFFKHQAFLMSEIAMKAAGIKGC